jgi:predicted transcriptional regulator
MININKLKGKIVEKGLSMDKFAIALAIDYSTLYRKLKTNGDTFSVSEVNKIVDALELTADEAMDIFFSHWVA